ncbi:MAG: cell division protein FtsA [Tannerella sp.]|nr:cell division protein FtsA [Tannerella sp.]
MVNDIYIVALDLGSSRFMGMIGQKKNNGGKLRILAKDSEDSKDCMRRGRIINVEDAAMHIGKLIRKLENAANKDNATGQRIKVEKVYIGVNGQSLHSIEHSEAKIINHGSTVTEEDMQILKKQCNARVKRLKDDKVPVFSILPPVYYLDGKETANPPGATCRQFKASYKLIVGWHAIHALPSEVVRKVGLELADIIVSPLSLADIILSPEEKESGCILIHMDYGVTPISVYNNNSLVYFGVVPFGYNLITQDLIKELNLTEEEAEELKNNYADLSESRDKKFGAIDYIINGRKLDKHKADIIIGARAREIVEHMYSLVKAEIQSKPFGGSIKLTGEASDLKGLDELISRCFKMEVLQAGLPWECKGMNTDELTTISLLVKGTENCVKPFVPSPVMPPEDPKTGPDTEPNTGMATGTGVKSKLGNLFKGLFDA